MSGSGPSEGLFSSWLMGGFEGASMVFETTRRIDVIGRAKHDVRAEEDYRLLTEAGIRTVRDALRWHLIEPTPGRYDWSSFLPMLRAARRTGTQVIWDLCHFGVPDGIDPWSGELVDRFAAFARATARVAAAETDAVPVWCPVNEISYWAFAGGEHAHFQPDGMGRGGEWKRQLVRMTVAAVDALRDVDPRARIVHTDPIIHIAAADPDDADMVEGHRCSMFEAWDMIGGLRDQDLGGSPACLDIVGVNFYFNNEWIHDGPRLEPGDALYRPLHVILAEVAARYGRPMIIAETGHEGDAEADWLRHVMAEVRIAAQHGTVLDGLCIYPVMDYPGWTDDRHCACGLIDVAPDWASRRLNTRLADAVRQDIGAGLQRPGFRTSP